LAGKGTILNVSPERLKKDENCCPRPEPPKLSGNSAWSDGEGKKKSIETQEVESEVRAARTRGGNGERSRIGENSIKREMQSHAHRKWKSFGRQKRVRET